MSQNSRAGLRQAIIEASLQLGSELGEDGLTMRGIASRLSVSATALYQHFDSKSSILSEIRLYGTDLLADELIGSCAAIEDPLARVRKMALCYIDFARQHPWLYTVLMQSERLDWSGMEPADIQRTLRPLTTLRAWIREGAEKGAWRVGVDPEVASFRLWAGLHGLCALLLNGRIDENHPAFPIRDHGVFVEEFVDGIMSSLTPRTTARSSQGEGQGASC